MLGKRCRKVLTIFPPMLFFARMQLLTTANTKIRKGEKKGYMSFGLHLAPHKLGGFNVCPHASHGCIAACLNTAGRGLMSPVQAARIAKTKFFGAKQTEFMEQLHKEITKAIAKAKKAGMVPCFRLNLTSDLPWESLTVYGKSLMEHFSNVTFYDYTKNLNRMKNFCKGLFPINYHLTFSRSECNGAAVNMVLAAGGNVAAVFAKALPSDWQGAKVIDGDLDDLRFLDPKNSIVGLAAKGKAKKDLSNFVVA